MDNNNQINQLEQGLLNYKRKYCLKILQSIMEYMDAVDCSPDLTPFEVEIKVYMLTVFNINIYSKRESLYQELDKAYRFMCNQFGAKLLPNKEELNIYDFCRSVERHVG